jgi:hypothetical protein
MLTMAVDPEKNDSPAEDQVENVMDNLKARAQALEDAHGANIAEHEISLKQALRENWKAVLWSAIISLAIVMEGYDQRFVQS